MKWLLVIAIVEYAGLFVLHRAVVSPPIVYASAPSWVPPPVAVPTPYEWMTIDADVRPPYDMEIAVVSHCDPPTFRRCTAWVRRR